MPILATATIFLCSFSGTITATSTNSSLNESHLDVGEHDASSVSNGHSLCGKHAIAAAAGSIPSKTAFGSMENLGGRLGTGGSYPHRYRTTSFSSYRSSSVNSQHTRENSTGSNILQTRCNRSYHDNTCCLTKNKDIIKDERIVFVTGKTRGPIGIFSALSANHTKRHHQRDHHNYHTSRYVYILGDNWLDLTVTYFRSDGAKEGTHLSTSNKRHTRYMSGSRQLSTITDGESSISLLAQLGFESHAGEEISFISLLVASDQFARPNTIPEAIAHNNYVVMHRSNTLGAATAPLPTGSHFLGTSPLFGGNACHVPPSFESHNAPLSSTVGNGSVVSLSSTDGSGSAAPTPPPPMPHSAPVVDCSTMNWPYFAATTTNFPTSLQEIVYHPYLLDDPELVAGKHSTLLTFPAFMVMTWLEPELPILTNTVSL